MEQFIKRKEIKAPSKVKINGIFFKIVGANSASKRYKFSKFVVTEFKKKGVPIPIKRSFEKYPQKILPKAKNIKGKTIIKFAS